MINFECAFDETFVFEKAQKLFKNCEYWAFVTYITDKIELFASDNKSKLYVMLGRTYVIWECYDRAVVAFQFALLNDSKNGEALGLLAKVYMLLNEVNCFKDAFMAYASLVELKNSDNELINFFNSLLPQEKEQNIALVDDEFRMNYLHEQAQQMLYRGEIDEAVDLFEYIRTKYPEDMQAYDKLIFLYMTTFNEKKVLEICEKKLEYFPEDLDAITIYLATKHGDKDFDGKELYAKMLTLKIESLYTLKNVCEVVSGYGDYKKCLQIIADYVKEFECRYNHDILWMLVIANLKLGYRAEAKKLAAKINLAYGDLGLGAICRHIVSNEMIDVKKLKINASSFMPDELWYVANNNKIKLGLKVLNNKEVSFDDYWDTLNLLIMTSDEEDVIDFLLLYKDQFTLKNPSKIVSIIYSRNISDIMKAGILYALLSCGVADFTFVSASGVNSEKFEPIPRIEDFPKCYQDAYMYAFAYCGLNLASFSVDLHTSTNELLNAMSESKRKFQDAFTLAAAIICNSYLIISDDVIGDVARLVECNPKRLKRYISIIKKEGVFYDQDDDDMFENLIKRIADKIVED